MSKRARQQRQSSLTTSKDDLRGLRQKLEKSSLPPTDGRTSKMESDTTGGRSGAPLSSRRRDEKNDYLAQMRNKRKGATNANDVAKQAERNIERLMKDDKLNDYERVDAVKRQAVKMEQVAKQKEKLMAVANI